MLVLDTSAVIALTFLSDPDHVRVRSVIEQDRGPFVVPAGAACEIGYMLGRQGSSHVVRFLDALESGRLALDCGQEDFSRVATLVTRYDSLPLGYSDAAVIACAERLGVPCVSVDRDFSIVAAEQTFQLLP